MAMRRKLYLGSVSSLSFEEEDHALSDNGSSQRSDPDIHDHREDVSLHGRELHQMLTDRLEEQVDFLIKVSFSEKNLCTTLGLHSTLWYAVKDILRMSEEEPYGVRGATIFLKMKNHKGDEKYLGTIAADTSTVSTFNLTLILEEEYTLGVTIKNWLGQFFNNGKEAHVISPQYWLKKEKLYRSDSGITLSHFHM